MATVIAAQSNTPAASDIQVVPSKDGVWNGHVWGKIGAGFVLLVALGAIAWFGYDYATSENADLLYLEVDIAISGIAAIISSIALYRICKSHNKELIALQKEAK